MGLLIVSLELFISLWLMRRMICSLRTSRATRPWQGAFSVAALLGFILGCGLAIRGEVRVSETTRLVSLPMPLAVYRKEGDQWTDFITPPYVMYPGLAANALAITTVCTLPVWLAFLGITRGRSDRKP